MGKLRIVTLCALILMPIYVWAWGSLPLGSTVPAVVGWSCDDADIICESFEGSNGPNSEYDLSGWSEVTTGGTINAGATHSGTLSCSDKGSDAIQISNTGNTTLYSGIDSGSTYSVVYIQFYLNVTTENLGDGNNLTLFYASPSVGSSQFLRLFLTQVSGSLYLKISWYDGATWPNDVASSTISTGTWYRVGIYYDNSLDKVELYQDGSKVAERTSENAPSDDLDAFMLGGLIIQGATTTWQIDNLKIDSSAMPGACS